MSEIESITRTIQFYGLLRPPLDEGRIYYSRLWFDILQYPRTRYENFRYEPPQTFYGYVQAMSAERVVWYKQIEFDNQLISEEYDSTDLLHRSLVCHLDATNQSFINLGLALALPPFQVNNPIADREVPFLSIDEFRIRLITEETVCRVRYEYLISRDCDLPFSVPPPPPPPPPPRPPEPFPPPPAGEPPNPDIPPPSDAYDGDDDDGLTYDPNPEPPEDEFPIGGECEIFRVTALVQTGVGGPFEEFFDLFFGPIEDVFLESDDLNVICRGQASVEICQPGTVVRSLVSNNVTDFQLVSIESFLT